MDSKQKKNKIYALGRENLEKWDNAHEAAQKLKKGGAITLGIEQKYKYPKYVR